MSKGEVGQGPEWARVEWVQGRARAESLRVIDAHHSHAVERGAGQIRRKRIKILRGEGSARCIPSLLAADVSIGK